MTISWYTIRITILGQEKVLFNAYFSVDNITDVVQHFYYVNNNRYVDILLRDLGDNGSDNQFINNNFTNSGVNILSVIPFINMNFNNPYKLNLWLYNPSTINSVISFNFTNAYNEGWTYSSTDFLFTFESIPGLPPLSVPFFSMRSLFTNNAQVYYKSHSLSTGGGGSGVRNYRIKKRKT